MKTLWKWIAKVAFLIVSVGLFIYATTRSLHFIQATLPPSQQMIGYLGLLATGGGAVTWLIVFLHNAKGTGQKGLSLIFVLVDLLGEFALFTMDTLYQTGETGMTTALAPEEIRTMVLGLFILIALNILATFAYHLLDPDTSRRMREESAQDLLEGEVLKAIEEKAPQMAQAMVPDIISEWEKDFTARFTSMRSLGLGQTTSRSSADSSPTSGLSWPWTKKQLPDSSPRARIENNGDPYPCQKCGTPSRQLYPHGDKVICPICALDALSETPLEPVPLTANPNGHKPTTYPAEAADTHPFFLDSDTP